MDADIKVSDRTEEMGLSKNQYLEDMAGNRRNAKMEGVREKPTPASGVPRTAKKRISNSANLLSTDAKSEAERKVLPMEEAVDCSQESKRTSKTAEWRSATFRVQFFFSFSFPLLLHDLL